MSDKKHWIIKIVPALAFVAGIIMSSVGGVMLLSSSAKLALFEHNSYDYVRSEDCRFDYRKKAEDGISDYERTGSEISDCVKEKKIENKQRFQNSEKQDIVDGISILFVGLILVLLFRKQK